MPPRSCTPAGYERRGGYRCADDQCRPCSPFTSVLVGLRAIYTISPNKRILGVISGLKLGVTADMIQFIYSDFTYAGEPVTKSQAYVGTLDFVALF